MPSLTLKPTHKAVTAYYDSLAKFARLGVKHETAVRSAFQELLEHCARQFDWKLVPEYRIKRKGQADASADGALLDNYGLNHGLWEAKDSADDLAKEIKHKFSIGYPKQNILFWQPDRAVLYQNGELHFEADLSVADNLVKILTLFLEFAPPAIAEWEKAVEEFKDKVPQIGKALKDLIEKERQTNKKFIAAFEDFCSLCRGSLNPNISIEAVEEMIIQHILTERIFRKIFDVADFMQRNVIALEIEKVIAALNSRSFSRDDFSKSLEHFYGAIENAAATITDFHEKQTFLNTVYERFFQGFCVKVADTHGIVYTPQPLVNFMVASVERILTAEFGKTLADKDVHILDPFTGTGNFIVNLMRHIPKSALPHKYANELHCNEVMLLPYYVASMNIEHAYYEATGKYESFEGICLVDTFQTAEKEQTELNFFNEKNSVRVNRQKKAPIRVIIANPPYNSNQLNENDNNKNRKYEEMDARVRNTYVKDSKATLRNKVAGDPCVKAYRWASDRLGEDGVIVYVSNNSFIEDKQFDGMRKHIARDFSDVWVLDLKGDARTAGEKRRREGGNVFLDMVRVGVCITIMVRRSERNSSSCDIKMHRIPDYWKYREKLGFLEIHPSITEVKWNKIEPDNRFNWLNKGIRADFDGLVPIGVKKTEDAKIAGNQPLFRIYTLGASTNRDEVVYDFSDSMVATKARAFVEAYNTEIDRYNNAGRPKNVDEFVDKRVKWSRDLKGAMVAGERLKFEKKLIRKVEYRPFTAKSLYFQNTAVDRIGPLANFFPKGNLSENRAICLTGPGSQKEFFALMTASASDLHFVGAASATQIFPLFAYSTDDHERQDNITSKARTLFQIFYDDDSITAADIFHYVYAVLHHPAYRTRFAENLKRDLPRIPFIGVGDEVTSLKSKTGKKSEPPHVVSYAKFYPLAAVEKMQGDKTPDHKPEASAKLFHQFADAGKQLADLHVNYESAKEFKLQRIENKEVKLDWRVEAMKLTKDKAAIIYNDFLTLSGIPPEVFDYKLGNRSALEWVIDQYRVTRDEKGNIASDPNRMDDEEYIVRLIGQVITVSLETMKVVKGLPELK